MKCLLVISYVVSMGIFGFPHKQSSFDHIGKYGGTCLKWNLWSDWKWSLKTGGHLECSFRIMNFQKCWKQRGTHSWVDVRTVFETILVYHYEYRRWYHLRSQSQWATDSLLLFNQSTIVNSHVIPYILITFHKTWALRTGFLNRSKFNRRIWMMFKSRVLDKFTTTSTGGNFCKIWVWKACIGSTEADFCRGHYIFYFT